MLCWFNENTLILYVNIVIHNIPDEVPNILHTGKIILVIRDMSSDVRSMA